MRLDELLAGESESLEYKVAEPENRDKYLKTVVAFANGRGGKIIFGVANGTREVAGIPQDAVFSTMDAITNTIQDSCEPKIIPRNSMTTIDGKTLIIVEILPGMQPPYYIKRQGPKKGVYIRVGGTTRPAEDYQIQEMILDGSNRSFDQQPTTKPIKPKEADAFCNRLYKYAKKLRETDDTLQAVPLMKLTRNQLLSWKLLYERDGELFPANGYLLLDGKHSDAFDDAYIQCAVFKGTTRSIFLTHREFHGPLYEQIEGAYTFVLQYIQIVSKIRGLVRQDFYEMPTKSIRESIVNAVCHRSYLQPGQIQVALYDDRLEITSPGALTSDMTIEKMKRGVSIPRNKAISEAFKYMGIIDKWGSGIPRMYEAAKEYGLRPPKLEDLGGIFRIEMYRPAEATDNKTIQKTDQATNQKTDQSTKTDQPTIQKTNIKAGVNVEAANKIDQKTNLKTDQPIKTNQITDMKTTSAVKVRKMSAKEKRAILLRMLRENSKITQRECAKMLGMSLGGIKYHFENLQNEGILHRVGTQHSGHWELTEGSDSDE